MSRLFHIDDLEVDTGAYTVSRSGQDIPLPRLSFDLLMCLAEHPDQVVSMDHLMDQVWAGRVVNEDTVKQRIKLLRQALGDDSQSPRYIAAVRGRGYRLIPTPVSAKTSTSRPGFSMKTWVSGAVLLLLLVILLSWQMTPRDPSPSQTTAPGPAQRVLVLPLQNYSGQAADDYLADGLTEDLISALARISDLQVIARTTTMHYRNTTRPVSEIARELQVGTVLEGSIQRANEEVRITAQMIDAATETHHWARDYTVAIEDLPGLQLQLAAEIADTLRATVSEEAAGSLQAGSTQNTDAYQAYLKGREAYRRWTLQDNETAQAFYQEALQHDPGFALAMAGMANASALRFSEFGADIDALAEAEQWAEQALAASPQLPEALKARGIIAFAQGHYQQSLAWHEQALALQPNYDEALFNIAELQFLLGRWDEALRYQYQDRFRPRGKESLSIYLRNLGLDPAADYWVEQFQDDLPLSLFTDDNRSFHALLKGQFLTAQELAERMQRLHPELSAGVVREAEVALWQNDSETAESAFRKALNLRGLQQMYSRLRLAQFLLERGEAASAHALLSEVEQFSRGALAGGHEGWFHHWNLAFIHGLRGEAAAGAQAFQAAVDAGRRWYEWDQWEPAFATLRDEPLFNRALEQQKVLRQEMTRRAQAFVDSSANL